MNILKLAQKLADAVNECAEDGLRGEALPIVRAPIGVVFEADFTDAEIVGTRGCDEPMKRFRVVITELEQ